MSVECWGPGLVLLPADEEATQHSQGMAMSRESEGHMRREPLTQDPGKLHSAICLEAGWHAVWKRGPADHTTLTFSLDT